MIINKPNLYITLFILLFSLVSFSQKEQISLETHLKHIEAHFKVSFNYESGLLNNKIYKTCYLNENTDLKYHLNDLKKAFKLNFIFITDSKIVIRNLELNHLLFLDIEHNTPIQDLVINDINSKNTWVTNDVGEISFKNKTPKKLSISHLNYNKQTINIDTLKGDKIYLQKAFQNLDELLLFSYFTTGTYINKDGSFYIKSKDVDVLAGLTSHDVIKNLENLPQVVSNSESISDLIIRGGTQDQNLFTWNGIKVYQNHHFFGLISAFNENLISKISLYDNATPSRYGNNTSGVISLEHDALISKKTNAGIGANFLSLDAYIKYPISKKAELQFATRKSLTEFWESPTYLKYSKKIFQSSLVNNLETIENNDIISDDTFYFNDFQLQYVYKPNSSNTFNVNSIYLENNLSYIEESVLNTNSKKSDLKQSNMALGGNWEHNFPKKNKLEIAINYSKHTMNGGNFLLSKNIASKEYNSIENFESILQYNSKHYASGLNFTLGTSYDYLTIDNNTTNFNALFISNLRQRSSIINVFGSLYYQKNKTYTGLDIRNVYYGFLKSFQVEPRFHFTYKLLPKFDVQLRGERKTQNISQVIDLENNFLGIEKRRWYMANNTDAPMQKSDQLEIALILKNRKSTINASIYHKNVTGITTNNQGFQNLNQFENQFGKYTIKGIQGHYNYKSKNLNAWISYNHSINKYTFKGLSPSVFYNNNDIRHSFISGINLKHKSFNVSLGMEYNSGKPFTSIHKENPIIEDVFNTINYNTPNDERMQDYLRFDTTISYNFKLANHIKYKLAFGIINITNRKNILSRYYTLTEDRSAIEVLDKYGLEFTPNLSLNIDF